MPFHTHFRISRSMYVRALLALINLKISLEQTDTFTLLSLPTLCRDMSLHLFKSSFISSAALSYLQETDPIHVSVRLIPKYFILFGVIVIVFYFL